MGGWVGSSVSTGPDGARWCEPWIRLQEPPRHLWSFSRVWTCARRHVAAWRYRSNPSHPHRCSGRDRESSSGEKSPNTSVKCAQGSSRLSFQWWPEESLLVRFASFPTLASRLVALLSHRVFPLCPEQIGSNLLQQLSVGYKSIFGSSQCFVSICNLGSCFEASGTRAKTRGRHLATSDPA